MTASGSDSLKNLIFHMRKKWFSNGPKLTYNFVCVCIQGVSKRKRLGLYLKALVTGKQITPDLLHMKIDVQPKFEIKTFWSHSTHSRCGSKRVCK